MHLDVVELHAFYYRTRLGRIAQRALRERIVEMWSDTKGQTVAGFGFAGPMLRPFLPEARRVLNLMPGPQGVMPWPDGVANHSVLVEETIWPIATGSIDRLIVLHGLDTCEQPTALLAEIWRVLGPGGKALFVVPNRAGLWARRDVTPFGVGHPYTLVQLETQLKRHRFMPLQSASVLYTPPSHRPFFLRSANMLEQLGRAMPFGIAAGVVMVEVTKQIHARTPGGLGAAVRKPLGVLEGIAKPAGKPVRGTNQTRVGKKLLSRKDS